MANFLNALLPTWTYTNPTLQLLDRQMINHKKKGGASALYLASQNGHPQVVSHLLGLGARPSIARESPFCGLS